MAPRWPATRGRGVRQPVLLAGLVLGPLLQVIDSIRRGGQPGDAFATPPLAGPQAATPSGRTSQAAGVWGLAIGAKFDALRGLSRESVGLRAVAFEVEQLGRDLIVFLATTVAVVPLSKRAGITPILGFIIAGLLIGPAGLKLVGNSEADVELGDFGILFLLFNEGLELSKERFQVLVQFAIKIGLPQIMLTTAAIAALISGNQASLAGIRPNDLTCLFIIGAAGALSSSAFVFPVLKEKGWEERRLGVASCGVLLLQDLLVAPLLVVIPLLSNGESGQSVALVLLKAAVGFGAVVVAGSFVLQKIFEVVVDTRSMDTFVATALLIAVGMGALAQQCGLSNATGAFAAGVLLAGTDYRAQIQADIRPFQGILLGIFFMTAGAGLDPMVVFQEWPTVFSLVICLVVVKAIALGAIMPFTSLGARDSARMSLLLAGGGEFAFVLLSLAKDLNVLPERLVNLLNAVVILSMSLTPFLGQAGDALGEWLESQGKATGRKQYDTAFDEPEAADHLVDHRAEAKGVVVCGFGDVGQGVSSVLSAQMLDSAPLICFDLNPARVAEGALAGQPVVYGDGASPKLLAASGVVKPKAIVMAYNNFGRRVTACQQLSSAYPGVPIIARARSASERAELLEAGATSVLAESEEVTVQLSRIVGQMVGEIVDEEEARRSLLCMGEIIRQETMAGAEDVPVDVDLLAMDSGFSRQEVIRLWRIFQSCDSDGNGEIDAVEARELIARGSSQPVTDKEFNRFMRMLDADGSGGVTFEEFLAVYSGEVESPFENFAKV